LVKAAIGETARIGDAEDLDDEAWKRVQEA
jgi:hypothetical protein